MENTLAYLRKGAPGAMNWDAYFKLTEGLVAAGKTSGPKQTDYLIEITRLNLVRMNRLRKTVKLSDKLKDVASSLSPQTWLVLTEAWCGDAAQNIPIMNAIAEASAGNVTMKLILRDEHPEIMDEHLTNGSKGIPKLVSFDPELNHLFSWGPRPAPAQQMVIDYKAMPEPKRSYTEFSAELQKWYAVDRTNTIQSEFIALFEQLLLHEVG